MRTMKATMNALAAVVLAIGMLHGTPARAGTATLNGSLAPGGPTMAVVFISSPNCTGQGASQVLYRAVPLRVSQSGVYDFSTGSTDGFASMYLMTSAFDPAAAFPQCLAGDNSGNPVQFSFALTAGQDYFVVPFDDTFNQQGGQFSLTVSGPGDILTFGQSTAVPALGLVPLLLLAGGLAWFGGRRLRRRT